MIGSPPRRPSTRRGWWHAPTPWSPITAFPNLCGRSAWRRAHAASPWCSTPTGRRRRPTSCSGLPPTWCFPASACAPPPVSTTSAPRSPRLPPRHRLFSPSPRARGTCFGARPPRCAAARSLRSRRSTRWAPATCSTARSRSRSRKAATWSRRCGSPPRRPGSNARVLAAAWRPRAAPRSKPCWRRPEAGSPRCASGRWIEFQLQENSFLDTRQKRGEAKRSFYHARRDYIYFPYRGSAPMDAIDRKILALLQQDASHSVAEIGSLVGLSSTPCWKRIQRLEADGVIQRRVALVDQDKIGLGVTVFVSIETGDHSQQWLDRFAAEVRAMPEVMEFYRMAGDVDYMLRVVVSDIAGYDSFYKRLIAAVPLKNVTSRFAMEKIKATTALPIP